MAAEARPIPTGRKKLKSRTWLLGGGGTPEAEPLGAELPSPGLPCVPGALGSRISQPTALSTHRRGNNRHTLILGHADGKHQNGGKGSQQLERTQSEFTSALICSNSHGLFIYLLL